MNSDIAQRMEKLLRRLADNWSYTETGRCFRFEAQDIIRDLDRDRAGKDTEKGAPQ